MDSGCLQERKGETTGYKKDFFGTRFPADCKAI